jgi:hypothetical protein
VRIRIGVVVTLVALALAGCARFGSAGGGAITLDEKDNGHRVAVAPGHTVTVVLHSTYWTFAPLAGTGVLRQNGTPSVAASPPGHGCVPGGGCGTVTAAFTAVGAGVVDIQASRTSCGEAMRCAPDQASFTVTVVVGGATVSVGPLGPASSAPATPVSPGGHPPTQASAASATVTATEADNGRTVTVAVGEHLVVRLASTYWRFEAVGSGAALSSVGVPAVAASPSGSGCVPGGGCGTVTATYLAMAPGQATVAADRTSCGEALRCTGSDGTYRLHVLVR